MRKALALVAALLWMGAAGAQTIIGTLPFTLQNGSIADANQVMADFNTIVASVNSNAASAGANTNITALNGLTTPLVYTSGGTSNYIGGTTTGTPNAQIIASPIPSGFTLVTGKSVTFIAGGSNTGPMTLNVSSTGALNVFRQTSTGPAAMVGGELQVGSIYTAIYDGTEYQVTSQSPQLFFQPGFVADYAGPVPPSGWLLANGGSISRTTFANLFNALAYTSVSSVVSLGTPTILVPNSTLFQVGWYVGGSGVVCNSFISSIPDGTHVVINNNASGNGATTLSIGPYTQGDCSTTFTLPNYNGKFLAGIDGSTNITTATCVTPSSIGDKTNTGNTPCGAQTQTLTVGQIPNGLTGNNSNNFGISVTAGGNIPIASTAVVDTGYGSGALHGPATTANSGTYSNQGTTISGTIGSGTISVQITNSGGQPHPILPPTAIVYKIIKF